MKTKAGDNLSQQLRILEATADWSYQGKLNGEKLSVEMGLESRIWWVGEMKVC